MPVPTFPTVDPERRRTMLAPPRGRCSAILDTDTTNEVDDQFAIVWTMLRHDRIDLLGLTACPYGVSADFLRKAGGLTPLDARNLERRLSGLGMSLDDVPTLDPGRGVARAERDLHRWVARTPRPGAPVPVHAGAPAFLPDESTPVDSPAARAIVDAAHARRDTEGPLYVLGIGCATNIASALLLDPSIVHDVVVVWTAAYPSFWPHVNASFNMFGDLLASRVLLESGVPLHYQPGYYVGEELRVTWPEVQAHVAPHGELGAELARLFETHVLGGTHAGASKVIWDLLPMAWLLDPEWFVTHEVPTPTMNDEARWVARPDAPPMVEAIDVDRDAIFRDVYAVLAHAAS